MSKITKEKNLYIFEVEGKTTRTYSLDVNTGILANIKTNKAIKGCPAGMVKLVTDNRTISNVLWAMYRTHYIYGSTGYGELDKTMLTLADKFDAVGIDLTEEWEMYADLMGTLGEYISENFSDFVKLYKEKQGHYSYRKLYHIANELYKIQIVKKYRLEANDHFPQEWVNWFITFLLDNKNRLAEIEKYIPRLLYFVERGIYYMNSREISINASINELLDYAIDLKLDEIPKGDYSRVFAQIKKIWLVEREKIDHEKLCANNYLKELLYENDTFKVIIPTTREEFAREGSAQDNCVYSMYLKKVLKGETRVVFIRRKDSLDKSYITCEVKPNGRIQQYLTKYNYKPTEEDAVAFYREYQNYLNSVI